MTSLGAYARDSTVDGVEEASGGPAGLFANRRVRIQLGGQALGHFFLQLAHLYRVSLVQGRDGVRTLDSPMGFQTGVCFEFRSAMAAIFGSVDRFTLDLTKPRLVFGRAPPKG